MVIMVAPYKFPKPYGKKYDHDAVRIWYTSFKTWLEKVCDDCDASGTLKGARCLNNFCYNFHHKVILEKWL